MATIARQRLTGCDGFRVESPEGLVGWVEETWLGPSGEPIALAVRLLDGRRGLLVAEEVGAVVPESEVVVARSHGGFLELEPPRIEAIAGDGGRPSHVAASWSTTGELLEPPPPPGVFRGALLARRPRRTAPPPAGVSERPMWQSIALLYGSIALLAALVIALCFLIAARATGSPY